MGTTNHPDTLTSAPLPSPEERLKIWQNFKGIWQNRVPDPIEELEKIRKELDREFPSSR